MCGGVFVQKIGGYGTLNSMYFMLVGSFIGVCLSIASLFTTGLTSFSIIIWLFLFCGASIIPSLNGCILSSLPITLKGSGYSVQNVISNIIGLTPAPTIYGFLYEATKKTSPSFAYSACLGVSGIGFILISIATYIKQKNIYVPTEELPPEGIIEKALHSQGNDNTYR
jgi:predicted MFS family arabinose efflux permease